MNDIENTHLVNLINEILNSPGDTIPEELRDDLKDALACSTLICPKHEDGRIAILQIAGRCFLPASCDIEDFRKIFNDLTPEALEFPRLSEYLTGELDGIIINPGSFGFIVNPGLFWMIFNNLQDEARPPVERGYDVKVRMNGMRPIHWRDIIIPENITFYELDDILKTLWGFNGHHLSMFLVKNTPIRVMDETVADAVMADEFLNSRTTLINELFDKYSKITYWYDFGDDWQFDIEIKKAVEYDRNYVTIKRFKGKYGPIEDCSGVYGFSEVIYCAENPGKGDEDFEYLVDYLCEFDMEYVQERLERRDYVRRLYE